VQIMVECARYYASWKPDQLPPPAART